MDFNKTIEVQCNLGPPLGGSEKGSGALRASASPQSYLPAAYWRLLGRGLHPQTPGGLRPPSAVALAPYPTCLV